MRSQAIVSFIVLFSTFCVLSTEARRIRVRPPLPQEEEEQDQLHYYAAEPQDDQQHVVYVSSADQYNGLYGQPTASSRASQDEYIPRSKPAHLGRTKEPARAPPVQTIRNYNKVNDDGSFTFGYEAADGSFKEETRGTDCVVRGKYGYVDPDGNKREFTYVSGNPCDPNAPKDEEEDNGEPETNEADNGPANYPTRPIRPVARPVHVTPAPKQAVTVFQNTYDQGEDEQPEPEQVLRQQPIRRPATYITRPQYVQQNQEVAQAFQRSQHYPSTTPAAILYRQSYQPVSITPRPVTSTSPSTAAPTTHRPQLLQVAVTPRPSILYTKGLSSAATTASSPTRQSIDFDAEFQRYQQRLQHRFQGENHIASPTASPLAKSTQKAKEQGNSGQIYSSALVYDPATGQYNTQLYQTLPQTEGDFSLNQRIQPYVHQPQRSQAVNIQQLQAQSPLYASHLRAQTNPQQAYQQQQAETQFQNSAQLYAQQQKARALQQQQQQRQQPAQQFYYIQPQTEQEGGNLAAFLRGHNIQF